MPKSSQALSNLRGFAILNVLAFHAFIAYLDSNPTTLPPFDAPPFDWTGKPVVDSARFVGFDIFCAFEYLYLMQLMFFLSGVFVWSSLARKGGKTFLYDRLMRLGVPFLVGVYVLMPIAYFPAYLMTAPGASWSQYWAALTALPIWPSGPMWFLWFLFTLNLIAAVLYKVAPAAGAYLGELAARANERPKPYFLGLLAVSAATYIPLALVFNPWDWVQSGPFGFQPSFAPQYVLYFWVGLGIGAYGLERGLLAADGLLTRHWALLLGGTVAGFILWIIPTALIVFDYGFPGLQIVADLGFVLAGAAGCFGLTATFLRFGTTPWPGFDSLSSNAYGIYFVHYVFITWLQYLLLGVALFAIVKGAIVFALSLVLSWAAAVAIARIPISARAIGPKPRAPAAGAPVMAEQGKASRPVA